MRRIGTQSVPLANYYRQFTTSSNMESVSRLTIQSHQEAADAVVASNLTITISTTSLLLKGNKNLPSP
jgi:hypothetical protein